MTVTCIIPFFNERDRIIKVLNGVVKIKSIDQILLVNDGSTDGTTEQVRQHYPKLRIIHNKKNIGKTESIRTGLIHAKGEYMLLLDADLQNFQYKEIQASI